MPRASSCAVGSSRMRKRAPNDMARAISTIWRCSTVSVSAGRLASTATSHSSSNCWAAVRTARQLTTGPRPGWRFRKRFSAIDSDGMIVDFWYTHAASWRQACRSDSGGAGRPAKRIVPASAADKPVRIETSVDLPAPLRPTSAWASPWRTEMPTPARAVVAPKRFVTPDTSTAGASPAPSSAGDAAGVPRSVITQSVARTRSEVVPPQRLVVDVVLRHQWRAQLVLQHAVAHLDDRAVVVGRAGLERLALQRRLRVVEPVLGVQVGRLRDRRVDQALPDVLELLWDAVVRDDEDVLRVAGRQEQTLMLEHLDRARKPEARLHVDPADVLVLRHDRLQLRGRCRAVPLRRFAVHLDVGELG